MIRRVLIVAGFCGLCGAAPACAEQALVAVAANFAEVAQAVAREFNVRSEHEAELAIGSTGKLYAQIVNGAPFDVLLAADQKHPRKLESAGLTVPGSRRTYAIGRLVLWSADVDRLSGNGAAVLRAGDFRRLAMANPRLAPYGLAAAEAMRALGVYEQLEPRIVMSQNVAQAAAMAASGNAELAFIALSLVPRSSSAGPGSVWEVPAGLYAPVRQDGVLLTRAADNQAALAYLEFLHEGFARRLIAAHGYGID